MTELTIEQEDFMLEEGMDRYYNKKEKKTSQNQSLKQNKACMQDNSDYGNGMFQCIHCGGIFEENDLDRCDGDWICRECEDKLQ